MTEHNNVSQETTELSDTVTDRFFFFVYRKAEKIISAVYLVTNLIAPEEPLKWQLRHSALSLIGELLPLKDMHRGVYAETRVVPVVSELLSFIEIGRSAELVSPMNAELLCREIAELGRILKEHYGTGTNNDYLAADFFSVFGEDHHTSLLESVNNTYPKGHDGADIKDTIGARAGRVNTIKDNVSDSKGHTEIRKKQGVVSSSQEELAQERKQKIIAFLRQGGAHSTREIHRAISGYSEKTIQRDLNTLVVEGNVKQEGKRRWTRYSLTT